MEEPAPSRRRSDGRQPHRIEIVSYDPAWPGQFAELGRDLRGRLGDIALRIDHIGSTSVPGLAAKPIIDVQVSVASFEPLAAFKQPLERLGYVFRADNPERTKGWRPLCQPAELAAELPRRRAMGAGYWGAWFFQ